jgi:hypothetical protein
MSGFFLTSTDKRLIFKRCFLQKGMPISFSHINDPETYFLMNNELFIFCLLVLSDNIHDNVGVFLYIH